jgi:hypothetical protein
MRKFISSAIIDVKTDEVACNNLTQAPPKLDHWKRCLINCYTDLLD